MAYPKYFRDESGRWRRSSDGRYARRDLAERWEARYGVKGEKVKGEKAKAKDPKATAKGGKLAGSPKLSVSKKSASKRSESARKAAATRKERKLEAERLKVKRSASAKKAAETRKQKKLELAARRSEAAKKGAATRKANRAKALAKKAKKPYPKAPTPPIVTPPAFPPSPIETPTPAPPKKVRKGERGIDPHVLAVRDDLLAWLQQFVPNPKLEVNRDGTIDGSVKILAEPKDILPDLEDMMSPPPHGAWVSIGGLYSLSGDWKDLMKSPDSDKPNILGKAYPQPGERIAENVATAMDIGENMEDYGRKAEYTIISIAWSPGGGKPTREF